MLKRIYFVILFCTLNFGFVACAIIQATPAPTELAETESYSYQPVPTDVYEISAIEGNADIKLPASAYEIYAYTSGFRDIFILVRFTMKADELEGFLESTLCTQSLTKVSSTSDISGTPSWWMPNQAELLEECYGDSEHSHQHILVDKTDSGVYIIYVSDSTY